MAPPSPTAQLSLEKSWSIFCRLLPAETPIRQAFGQQLVKLAADTVGIDSQNRRSFWPQKQGGSPWHITGPSTASPSKFDDDPPSPAFRRRGIPRYDGLPRYHRCDLRPRVVLGARPPHRAYPRHRAPSRLRRACLLAPPDASHALWSGPVHLCARLYHQGCRMSAKKPTPLCRPGSSQEAHRCLLGHRLRPCRRRTIRLAVAARTRGGRFGYDGRGQNASGNPR